MRRLLKLKTKKKINFKNASYICVVGAMELEKAAVKIITRAENCVIYMYS